MVVIFGGYRWLAWWWLVVVVLKVLVFNNNSTAITLSNSNSIQQETTTRCTRNKGIYSYIARTYVYLGLELIKSYQDALGYTEKCLWVFFYSLNINS